MSALATPPLVSFHNTEIAFKHKSDTALKKAYWLFTAFRYPFIVNYGPKLAEACLSIGLPIKGLVKSTIFSQFCGGETIEECTKASEQLAASNIHTILDYSVEGEETETVFDATCEEIIRTIQKAEGNPHIPFSVFKVTGIGRFALLEKVNQKAVMSDAEQAEFKRLSQRFERICQTAHDKHVRLFVDAEESWIQDAVDDLTMQMMARFNTEEAIIYNTIQLYRHDRLAYMKQVIDNSSHYLGFKLVRGAYMEKERARAKAQQYPSPIQPDKATCDHDYNEALRTCLSHLDKVSVCAGSHNEDSSMLLVQMMAEKGLAPGDPRIYFAQLLGMSDHISFNLANAGYNVAKYVPYGPVKAVLPYLSRRAKENSSVKGQVGRELGLISEELKRRKTL